MRKQLAKFRIFKRQLQSLDIDLTSTTRIFLYEGALIEEVFVQTLSLESEILELAISKDNQPFISKCKIEEELSSEEKSKVSSIGYKNIFDVL